MVGVEKSQLRRLSRLNVFSRWEVAELPKLLMPGEEVLAVLSGFYSSGTAILCVTSRRLLLVDKKIMRLSYEDMRFEAISDISFSQQALLASARFYIAGRNIQFRSWYRKELRILVQFVQDRMFESHNSQVREPEYNHYTNKRTPSQIMASSVEPMLETPETNQLKVAEIMNKPMEIPHHITERVARLQRAAKFVNELPNR